VLVAGLIVYLLTTHSPAGAHRTGGYVPSNRAIFLCAHKADCLGPGYPVFDSYTNTPNYGDERDFLNAKPATSTHGPFENRVTLARGDEELLRVYYDNDGDARAEPSPGASIARGARVAILLPYARAKRLTIAANITTSNAFPHTIGDTVTFSSSAPFNVVYVPGTARIWNRAHPAGLPLSNELLSRKGTLIGYQKMGGTITGCFCQSGYITLRILIE
jgi:hypothetical protein